MGRGRKVFRRSNRVKCEVEIAFKCHSIDNFITEIHLFVRTPRMACSKCNSLLRSRHCIFIGCEFFVRGHHLDHHCKSHRVTLSILPKGTSTILKSHRQQRAVLNWLCIFAASLFVCGVLCAFRWKPSVPPYTPEARYMRIKASDCENRK